MRVAIMAAGAVGGYFGGRLAAAGHDVSFIARGAQLAAIRQHGLKIESPLGDLHLADAKAPDDPGQVGPVDVVLFAVKLWDTEKAAEQARPMVGPDTRVITLQNGVDSVERLQPILGADRVAGGSAYIASVLAAPGVIRHSSKFAGMRCGRLDGAPDPQLERFVEAGKKAGIDIALSETMNRDRWQKFVFLVGLSGSTGVTREPLGPIRQDPDTRALLHDIMAEVVAVGRAQGVALPADYAEDRMAFADTTPADFKASLLHDLERGNRIEVDWLAGKVVALGRALSVPTPANAAVYAALKLHRMGKGG
jgi:2-dehydropantoate 2-reductase